MAATKKQRVIDFLRMHPTLLTGKPREVAKIIGEVFDFQVSPQTVERAQIAMRVAPAPDSDKMWRPIGKALKKGMPGADWWVEQREVLYSLLLTMRHEIEELKQEQFNREIWSALSQ